MTVWELWAALRAIPNWDVEIMVLQNADTPDSFPVSIERVDSAPQPVIVVIDPE